jgi:hypothetical protein
MYDYGFTLYDPATLRRNNIDPMAEKSRRWSSYSYAYDNPVYFIDPDGMQAIPSGDNDDDYGVDKNGNVKLLQRTNEKTDRLFAIDDKGRKSDDSVEVNKGLIGQLQGVRQGSEVSGKSYFSSISEDSKQLGKDYLSLFKFAADNTAVEFSLTFFDHKEKSYIELATYHDSESTPGPQNLGTGIDFKDVSWHVHDHPPGYASEMSSMGIAGKDRMYNPSDAQMAVKDKKTFPNNVYFPHSKNLYNVTMYGIQFINKVNNSNQFRK